jgi:hypothetical protein
MADRDISVITPATSQDLLSLEECKQFLNISLTDTSRDDQLQMQISIASAALADMANRKPELGFGETTVIETWREIGNGRLFLMHWPVKQPNGIISVTAGGTTLASGDYRLDNNSGKLSMDGTWPEPASVHYTGGWQLPEQAPLPLKWACATMVQEQRMRNQQAQTAGIRLLSHKEARVAFWDPNAILLKTVGAKSPGIQAAEALVRPYIRIEV